MMIFVTGGAFQGQTGFARSLVKEDETFIDDFNQLVKSWMQEGLDPIKKTEELTQKHPEAVIAGTEVGAGIVPMDPEAYAYRETYGRCCCLIAAFSQAVYRMTFGIPQRIK